jgi:hypothetical protein
VETNQHVDSNTFLSRKGRQPMFQCYRIPGHFFWWPV